MSRPPRAWCATALLVVSSISPWPARAGEIKLVDEVPCDERVSSGHWVSGGRYYMLSTGWGEAARQPDTSYYTLLDLTERTVVRISVSLSALRAKYGKIFGQQGGMLVHYDGRTSGLLFDQLNGYKRAAMYFCRFDHATKTMSEPLKLADLDDLHTFQELKPDPKGESFYWIVYARDPRRPKENFVTLDLGRVRIRDGVVDWTLRLELPKRTRPLDVSTNLFNEDGTRLAFIEHNEKLYEKGTPAIPRQQAYVIDIDRKAVTTLPVPLSPYGHGFSRDGRTMLFGSNELGEIWRVNLKTRRVEQKVQGPRLIHKFVMAPSGKEFFVAHDTEKIPPKVVHIYAVDTLTVQRTIPEDRMPSEMATREGRYLLQFSEGKVRFHEVPDDVGAAAVTGASAAQLRLANQIGAGRTYMLGHDLDFYDADTRIGAPRETFAPIMALPDGDVLVAGTFDDTVGNEYIVGATHPTIARVDPAGTARWSRDLKTGSFPDSRAGAVAATRDGGCVAFIASFPHHQRSPIVRLVRFDAAGKPVWDMHFRGDGGHNTPIAERLRLEADERVAITGYIYLAKDMKRSWTAVVDAHGKIVSDTVGK